MAVMRPQFLFILGLFFPICFGSRIHFYPHPSGMQRSNKFHVNLKQGSMQKQSTFLYISTSDHRATEESYVTPHRSVSWTSFAFTGDPVTAEIIAQKDFRACVVRPKHYGFQCHRTATKTAEVIITHNTRMISVEFDYDYGTSGHSDIVDKLLIFADAPEQQVPQNHKAHNILYYGAGVHDLGGQKLIDSHISEVYLAPGAYVHGAFNTTHRHPGVKIHGRGILSGERYAFHDPRITWSLILLDGGGHHVTEGVVLVDPTMYYLRALSHNNEVRNIKTVASWTYNSDGVALGPNGIVKDSFIMANDDALKIYNSNLTMSRCVVWQSHNGAVFQFGWWTKRVLHDVHVSDVDVIHTDWCAFKGHHCYISQNSAVFDLAKGMKTLDISDMEFRDVRIEGACPRLFNFQVPVSSSGSVNNVRLINLSVEKASHYTTIDNYINGTINVPITNWEFVNFKIHSSCITNADQADIHTGKSTTIINFHCDGSPIVG